MFMIRLLKIFFIIVPLTIISMAYAMTTVPTPFAHFKVQNQIECTTPFQQDHLLHCIKATVANFMANFLSKFHTDAAKRVGNVFWAGGITAEKSAYRFSLKNGVRAIGMTAQGIELKATKKGMNWLTQARPL
jgi:hypothetical protein